MLEQFSEDVWSCEHSVTVTDVSDVQQGDE